jgi:internalin A
MFSWQELSRQLQQIVNTFIHFVKVRRREEAAIGIAAILFWVGYSFIKWLPAELQEWAQSRHGNLIIPGVFYIAGLIFLLYGTYRIWRLVYVPDLPPVTNRPSAIKGPLAFTPADGDLFRKLGREDELRKLLGYIEDDQVQLIVLRGESGAGKTSLLRAGLTDILKDKGIRYHYWEAVPTNSGHDLLRAIQETWRLASGSNTGNSGNPALVAEPNSLDELINPSAVSGLGKHVIVLDQLEQLHNVLDGPVFQLLRKVAREAKPPYLITWVVAFRREFQADWADFMISEQEREFYPREISLRLFTEGQARDVIGQLTHAAGLAVDQKVVDSLVEAAALNGKVSPVDIGIGLLVLSELREQRNGKTVTANVYHFAGGAEGLLTQYVDGCLDNFLDEDRKSILKAMLALCEPETNQRVAEGKTGAEIAQEIEVDARRLRTHLERLTQRDMRLLEHVATFDGNDTRYRLPHERLIPAINRLSGLGKKAEAKQKLEYAFSAWKNSKGASQYLLRSRDLRLVERYKSKIPLGKDELEKLRFLKRSQQRRTVRRVIMTAGIIYLVVSGWFAYSQYRNYEVRNYLRSKGYPPELYDWQHQLKSLEVNAPVVTDRFPWLHSNTLEEFTIEVSDTTDSLDGLAENLTRCPALKKLNITILNNKVNSLEPLSRLTNLTQLDINLAKSEVSSLEPLSNLTSLTQLKLRIGSGGVSDLTPLSRLTNLTDLDLDLDASNVSNVESLSNLTNLTQLDLDLGFSEVSDLTPLSNLTKLTQLTVRLNDKSNLELLSKITHFKNLTQLTLSLGFSKVSSLEPLFNLPNLSNLTQLNLYLGGSDVSDLNPLSSLTNLKNLTQFDLGLGNSKVSDLAPLSNLTNLTQLKVSLNGISSAVSSLEPLSRLTNLTQLDLDLSDSKINNLKPLSNLTNLTQLKLDLGLSGSQISSLEPLSNLKNLTLLDLDLGGGRLLRTVNERLPDFTRTRDVHSYSKVISLKPLSNLTNLTQLKLSIGDSKIDNLGPLSSLTNLTHLELSLGGSDVKISSLEQLSNIPHLVSLDLNLSGYDNMVSLKPLSNFTQLTQLTLNIPLNRVISFKPLSNLTKLTQLDLNIEFSFSSINDIFVEPSSDPTEGSFDSLKDRDLAPLSSLIQLHQLKLNVSGTISNLEPLSNLTNLTQLDLDLGSSDMYKWEPLTKLNSCQTLLLTLTPEQRMALTMIPKNVTRLKL